METTDVVIIGAGIIGLTIARQIKLRWPEQSVAILEKEPEVALHASGRNSGVVHAGFYYAPDSLKAKLTNTGNNQMLQFCQEHGIKVNHCGKLVVATSEADLITLDTLYDRGVKNGVDLELIDEAQAKTIEPRARVFQKAIYSPDTSAVNPVLVTKTMAEDCRRLGVSLLTSQAYISGKEGRTSVTVATPSQVMSAGFLINASGLYADKIAHSFGVGENFHIQPFKGLYLYANQNFGKLNTHVYPVPDLRNPFLGVHFTITVDGHVKIGPTATPALWREQYDWGKGFSFAEFTETTANLARLLLAPNSTIRRSAPLEASKYIRRLLVRQAGLLVDGVTPNQFRHWGESGIRAQLVDKTTMSLVNDFLISRTERTIHILNAISPAFTSSLPFASVVANELERPN